MYRKWSLILVLLASVSLSACGNKGPLVPAPAQSQAQPAAPASSVATPNDKDKAP